MNEERLGVRIMFGSSGVVGAVSALLLVLYWPPMPEKEDPVEVIRRMQLGPSGPGLAIRPPATPAHPGALINGDLDAIQTYAGLSLQHVVDAGFQWMGTPRRGSWRAGPGRFEEHQDFRSYKRTQRWNKDPKRRVIVIRPLGPWPASRRALVPLVTRFVMLYFQRPVRWEDREPVPANYRLNLDGAAEHLQYEVGPILDRLQKDVPDDALAVVGLTHLDLYPAPSWGFVFGMADLSHRVAVVSFSRLHPSFWGLEPTPDNMHQARLRLLRVLAHEVSHTLGIHHCLAFRCVMNGCNSLREHDRAPVHLCPLCMAKLAWRLDLRVRGRYGGLAKFFETAGYPKQARWYRRQLLRLTPEVEPNVRRAAAP